MWGVGTRTVIRVNGMSQVPPNSPPPPPPGGPSGWPAPPGSQGQDRPAGGSQAPGQPPVAQGAAGYFVPVGQPPEDITGLRYQTGMTIFLSIITVGVWAAIWTYRTKEDLKRYNGDGLGGVLGVVLYLVFAIVLMFTIPNEIEKMYQRDNRQSPVSTTLGLWFLLPLIGNIIWYVKVQRALNEFWASKGSRTA